MGLSPWLGASVATLLDSPAERADFLSYLREQDLYVYTVNAFPHGPFKGRSVMEQVYEPDWATEDRTRYTMGVADVLVDITVEADVEPSIQTAPWPSA